MSTSDDTGPDFEGRNALVAEYVLGVLSAAEHQRVERLIENDQGLRAERDFWISRFGALNDGFKETTAPTHIYQAIEARVFGASANKSTVNWWESLLVWRSIAGGAMAVAVAALGFNLIEQQGDVGTLATQLVAALEEEGSNVKFVALYDGTGNVRLTALSGEAVPDRDFELWAIQGDSNPVSMGVVPVNARSSVAVPAAVLSGLGDGSVLAITLEPKGGSPTGDPTGPIVAKGAVTAI